MYKYENLQVGNNTYEIYRFGTEGKPDMLFMPGFTMRPHYYDKMFRSLDNVVNGVSAKMIGVYPHEHRIKSLQKMADEMCELAGSLFESPFGYSGHSTGATLGLYAASILPVKWLCLFSPLTQVDHDWMDLWLKTIKLGVASMADPRTAKFSASHGPRLIRDIFYDMNLSIELIDSLANFDYWPGMDSSIKCDTKVIFAEKDEFGLVPDDYNLEKISAMHDPSVDVSYITLKKAGHLWPIKYPKRAAGYIKEMVNQVKN